jgi:predicted nucleotidyltransferase
MIAIGLNKEVIIKLLTQNKEKIKSFGVLALGLFGSFSQNKQHEGSDVDLLIDFEQGKKTYDNFIGLSFFLEELLGAKVEMVTRQALSKHIGPYILKQVENVPI